MRSVFVIAIASLTLSAGPAVSKTSLGVLTCSSEGTDAAARPLNCTLKSTSGITSRFEGVMKTPVAINGQSRRVYIWYVSAPRGTKPSEVAGRYVRNPAQDGDEARTTLIGGKDDAIALQPPVNKDQLPGEGLPAVLELDLKALRT